MTVIYKVTCDECNWHGYSNELLEAKNPFDKDEVITACPECRSLDDSVYAACDEPGCFGHVTCGTPTDKGYRQTCSKHKPEVQQSDS